MDPDWRYIQYIPYWKWGIFQIFSSHVWLPECIFSFPRGRFPSGWNLPTSKVLDFCGGGELFFHMLHRGRFEDKRPTWGNEMKKHTASKRRVSFMQNHQFWEFLFFGEILRQVTPLFWGGAGWMGVLVQKRFFRIPWIEIILQAMHMKKMAKLCGEIKSWLSHPPSVNHFAFGNHAHQFLLTFQLKTELLHIYVYIIQWTSEVSNGSRSLMGNSISPRSCWVSNTFTRSRSASGDGMIMMEVPWIVVTFQK